MTPEWWECKTHGKIGGKHAWGCPECVVELRRENLRARDVVEAARAAKRLLECSESGVMPTKDREIEAYGYLREALKRHDEKAGSLG